jgi:ABC-type sulfate/molybdate transport systems ATPase subunit
MTGRDEVLRGIGLHVRRGRTDVLHGVDVSVVPGEIVAVLGPNGAGKSTLLNTLNGTIRPVQGRVERHGRVATLLQTPGLARRSARANVELAMAWWGVPHSQRRNRSADALDRMQAGHLARRPAQALSGGEQRRIHLARAVAVAPDVLLLDEPFDGLDPQTHAELRDDTAAALRSGDAAAVVVLHDRSDAWAMADRIVVLLDGRVHADGPPQAILDQPPTAAVARFLGYDGELRSERGVLLTRRVHVRIDPAGPLAGRVGRVVRIEDGQHVRVDLDRGRLWATHRGDAVHVDDVVRLQVDGGAEFADAVEPS